MKTDGETRLLGLIGKPVRHTLSPVIHNELSGLYGYNEVYVPFETDKERLGDAVRGAYALGILGLNVTVPHKNDVMEYLIEVDEGARAIGAVNTLVMTDGGYKGYNTDMMGLLREIDSYGIEISGKWVIILGAGGAARAAAYMCMEKGAERIYILNRTIQKAQRIADDMNEHFQRSAARAMSLSDYPQLEADSNGDGFVVFQATQVGLAPDGDAAVIEDADFYRLVSVGVDLIYNPYETRFMRLCKAAGADCYNGLRMLLYQGVTAYELWNGIKISDAVADMVYRKLEKAVRRNVILIGFMGSGKTTVGRNLAELTGEDFIDVDEYIEEQQGCTVQEIFDRYGEDAFRKLETETISRLSETCSSVILSTGGGLPLRRENADILRSMGYVVYLKTTPDEVLKRLAGDTTRPLLKGYDVKSRVSELMVKRAGRYETAAEYSVDTVGRDVCDIAKSIIKLVF